MDAKRKNSARRGAVLVPATAMLTEPNHGETIAPGNSAGPMITTTDEISASHGRPRPSASANVRFPERADAVQTAPSRSRGSRDVAPKTPLAAPVSFTSGRLPPTPSTARYPIPNRMAMTLPTPAITLASNAKIANLAQVPRSLATDSPDRNPPMAIPPTVPGNPTAAPASTTRTHTSARPKDSLWRPCGTKAGRSGPLAPTEAGMSSAVRSEPNPRA